MGKEFDTGRVIVLMSFMDNDYLLTNDTARMLYHEHAAKLPVIDYHCHIDAEEILSDKRYVNLTQLWLGGDHYKWRLMRTCGVDESYITGDAPDYDKFMVFAEILPLCAGNPVYQWTHLELQRFFNIYEPLCRETASGIWEETCKILSSGNALSARNIPAKMNVEVIITTDDPADNLNEHADIAEEYGIQYRVLPCFRPDAVMDIENAQYPEYIARLGKPITNFEDLKKALTRRMEHFDAFGCRAADHGLYEIAYSPSPDKDISDIIKKALSGKHISPYEAEKYRYALLSYFAGEYTRLGWVMELHLGVLRNINTVRYEKYGANTGFDCIGAPVNMPQLAKVLDALNCDESLPKTLLFSINPNDNAALSTLAGCFNRKGIRGKVQQGSAWWFNDSYGGIRQQLASFAENGVLGNFIGMLTDSRSMLSYTRHEFFRRILCDYIGALVTGGQYPDDTEYLKKLTGDICYFNVKRYFEL